MYNPLRLFSKRLFLGALLAGCQILIASAAASAAERPEDADKRPTNAPPGFDVSVPAVSLRTLDQKSISTTVSVIGARKGEMFHVSPPPGVQVLTSRWPIEGLFFASGALEPTNASTGTPRTEPGTPPPNGKQAPAGEKRSTVASTVPMTAREKFNLFLTESFKPPAPYALSILSGVWDEAIDSKHKKPNRSAGDFAADSLTHAARSYAFRVTSNFFEKFAYPVAFKQDPRYHRSPYTSFWPRVKYAVSRVLITQGDRNGKNEFNISFLAGGLTTAGISNLWEPGYHQNIADTMTRFGTHIGLRALTNILSELIGGQ